MSVTEILSKELSAILELARMAPSVHNTQPWHVSTHNDAITIKIDTRYQLHDGDPTGRQTIISLGIFAEAIAIVAPQFGLAKRSVVLDGDRAVITLRKYKGDKHDSEIQALQNRVTDRSIYKHLDIDNKTCSSLQNCSRGIKAKIWVLTDDEKIREIASLTAKGIGVALSNPSFRNELSEYLLVPWSSRKRGISTSSLYIPSPLAVIQPFMMKTGLGVPAEVALEKKRWLSASGIVFITTRGDMPTYWFEAGRAYIHVALKIEELGLSQATSAATVEASNYHEDVEAMLHTSQRLQSVIRIGKGARNRNHSPRISVEELIT